MGGLRDTFDALVTPSGGLRYHMRALGHGRRLWGPFRRALARWLAEWEPGTRPLLLVGPSAGWCLPDAFLQRFPEIDVLEPDPLAWLLLGRRLRRLGCRTRWHTTDYLEPHSGRLPALAADFPEHAILFCNVLGQLGAVDPDLADDVLEQWSRDLGRVLRAHHWATFHDRLSGALPPSLVGLSAPVPSSPSDEELVQRFYQRTTSRTVTLDTHGTASLLAGHPRWFLAWHLSPGHHHLIEAIRHSPE